jgi:class 3 adenylate cyclase
MPDDYCGTFQNIPSVSHFHGALLFVDISGFTILSQRLPVDELRTQINSYFKKIIDIVDEHGGDVIKFAGDALFIVWQTVQSNDEATMKVNMQQAGLRALRCGLDINFKCGNYPVPLKKSKSLSPHEGVSVTGKGVNVSKIVLEARSNTIQGACSEDIEYTYLNVHSGLSMGSMTGIDVGAMDRWEFFVIGQPLHDVAEAEASAEKGQLVMSASTHDLLCCATQNGENASLEVLAESESVGLCGCIQNSAGCFRIPDRRVPQFENFINAEEEDDLDRELRFYQDVMKASTEVFSSIKTSMILKFRSLREKLIQDRNISASLLFGSSQKHGKEDADDNSTVSNTRSSFQDLDANIREEESLQSYFMRWISDCLKNDFARHVHEADRVQFSMGKCNRTNVMEQFVHEQMNLNRRKSESSVPSVTNGGTIDVSVSESAYRSRQNTLNSTSHSASPSSMSGSASTSSSSGSSNFVSKIRTLTQKLSLRDRSHAKHERALRNDSGLNGELRNVIVLFIAVHGEPDLQQPIPHRISLPNNMTFVAPPSFNFSQSPFANPDDDKKWLAHYLSCMDVIVRSLKEYGGQLRQFIVDDKGTVSIGTFGLRGSTNVDNAAAAIESAMNIIHGLQAIGLNSSIGITAGSAYCGIVGSLRRHEYAVMGPSVNLSARLMGKAKKGEILCDSSIRNQDRAHQFKQVGEVHAKGFALPVAIFKPSSTRASVFMDPQLLANAIDSVATPHKSATSSFSFPGPTYPLMRLYSDGGGAHTRGQSGPTATLGIRDMHLFGRDAEIERVYNFLFESMRISESDNSVHPDSNANVSGIRFEYSSPCRASSLDGSSGIGKSAVLEYFAHISRDLMVTHNVNVSTFFHPCSSLDGRDPYKSWKTVVRHMFARISRSSDIPTSEQPGEVDREKLRDKWLRGAMELVKNLSPQLQQLLPLLSIAHIIPGIPETNETMALSGAEKLRKVGELLEAMLLEYPKLTKTLTIILLDDVHLSDAYSMQLFTTLLRQGRGINFLITWNLDLERSLPEEQKLVVEENAKVFEDFKSEKIIEVPIVPLTFESLKAMISGVLLKDNIFVSNDEIFKRLAEITGGNPLYAYELAKAIVDKYKCSTAAGNVGEHNGNDSMLEIIDSFKAHRVEEVIFYRLDRLEPKTQMLLKLASVACASGSSKGFSLELLATMLKGNYDAFGGNFLDQLVDVFYELEETKKIMKILAVLVKSLVDSGEFLKFLHDRNRTSFSSETSIVSNTSILDDLMMLRPEALAEESAEDKIYEEFKDLSFDFKIGLERNMIYELMLEDQKESLHDRVATFLEKKNSARDSRMILSSNDLLEEAFHWERAKIWTNALSCYYRAALALEELGAFTGSYRYYAAGFRCFTNLQKTMGENLLSMLNCDDSSRLVSLMMRIPHKGLEALISVEECNEYVRYRHAIYRVVAGDESLLTIIVRTITKFAQGAGTLEKNVQITLTLYREALQLIFFTWKHRYLQDMYSGQLQHMISATAVAKQQTANAQDADATRTNEEIAQDKPIPSTHSSISVSSHQLEKQEIEKFGLPDIQLIFPVLSGIASMFRMRRIPDDEMHSKESLFYDAMVVFASQSSDHLEHQLQAMCLLHSLALESENYGEAQSLIEKITVFYDYDKYSAILVSIYGNDRVPYTLAVHAQLLILLGQLPSATLIMQSLMQLVPRIVHLHSMGILAISLSTALIVMGRVEDACRVFEHYYSYEQSKPKEAYSFFRDTNPVMATWHKLYSQTLLLASTSASSGTMECSAIPQTSPVAAGLVQLLETDEVMDKIVQKEYFFLTGEKRPLLFDALASFGACLEYIAAEILSMMALIRIKYIFDLLLASPEVSSDEVKQAEVKLRIEETKNILNLAVEYIDLGIHVASLSNKLKFPYLLAVLAKVKILLQIDSFHGLVEEAMKEHSFLSASNDVKIAENGNIFLSITTENMEQSVALLLQEIEVKGAKFQMPFMSFAAVILSDVIFGDESSKNRFETLQLSFATPAAIGGNEILAHENIDKSNGNDEEKHFLTLSNGVSVKSVTEAVAGDVALAPKVAAAAMHLSGIDMQFVKVLEESLPHFWCGNFRQKKKRFISSSVASNSNDAIATTIVNTK